MKLLAVKPRRPLRFFGRAASWSGRGEEAPDLQHHQPTVADWPDQHV
jgi:hypothetical protein